MRCEELRRSPFGLGCVLLPRSLRPTAAPCAHGPHETAVHALHHTRRKHMITQTDALSVSLFSLLSASLGRDPIACSFFSSLLCFSICVVCPFFVGVLHGTLSFVCSLRFVMPFFSFTYSSFRFGRWCLLLTVCLFVLFSLSVVISFLCCTPTSGKLGSKRDARNPWATKIGEEAGPGARAGAGGSKRQRKR